MAEPQSEPSGDAVAPILAEYRRLVDRGEQVDREQFIAANPEAADQLRAYFAQQDVPDGVAEGTEAWQAAKPAALAQAAPPPESGGPVTHAQSLFTSETTGYPWKPVPGAPGIPTASAGPVSVEQVASFLTSSGLLSPEKVSELLSRASQQGDSADVGQVLDELQNSGRLTPFQCEAIRRGQAADLILGNYVLMDRLGHGGMGQVFRAWHRKMKRTVALKTLRPETMNSEKAVERFRREVETAARLAHPNIVTAHDADESRGVYFLVMEHVDGSDLADHIRLHGPASVAQAADWVLQAARGLHHAHQHGIIHRDIKPGNLLLGSDGAVKVLDMGLARLEERLAEEGAVEGLTQTGDVLGTLDYMAPEQAEDTAHADARADIYSLGCTLFYLLTGRAVYGGHTAVKKILAHREQPVPSLASERRVVPEQIDALFRRMVAKNPADRPASMAEVIAELEPFVAAASTANEGTATFHGPLPKNMGKAAARSSRRNVVAGAVAVAVAMVFLAGMAFLLAPTPDGAQLAEQDKPELTAEVVESDRPAKVTDTDGRWAGWPSDAPAPAIAPFDADQARRHQEEWAEYLGLPLEFTNSIGMKFVLIPPGEFLMGSSEEAVERLVKEAQEEQNITAYCYRLPAEAPRHRVRITRPFYLGVYQVTQAEYEQVVGVNPSHFSAEGEGAEQVAGLDTSRHPVVMVSWAETAAFCEKLSAMPEEQTAGRVYALPTEAQWEYACRAGTTTKWSYGDDAGVLRDYAWFGGSSGNRTHDVGERKPNAFGLFDMHGNVWEMCADWFGSDYYAVSPVDDPQGPASGSRRVLRGGCKGSHPRYCRSAYRHLGLPESRSLVHGFRVVLVPAEADSKRAEANVDGTKVPSRPSVADPPADDEPRLTTDTEVAVPATPWSLPPDAPASAIAPFDADQARKHQEEWAEYLGLPMEFTNSIGMKFVLIPPGEFMMGSSEEEVEQLRQEAKERQERQWYIDRLPSEAPRHRVRITRPFYLGLYEVTQAEYLQVMGVNPSEFASEGNGAQKVAGLDTSHYPVEMVAWNDAKAFCEKLSAMPEEQAAGRGYVLPTEAQWEYACRAGTTTKWSFGDDEGVLGNYAWFSANSGGRTLAVGEKKPNAFGLFDMHGNVWEWCADWFGNDYYPASPVGDPPGAASGSDRVIRGGCWSSMAGGCRSAFRRLGAPSLQYSDLGFRVVLVLAEFETTTAEAGIEGPQVPSRPSAADSPADDEPQLTTDTEAAAPATPWSLPPDAPAPAIAPFDADQARKHQEEWAEYLDVPVEFTNSIGMKFVLIPPGEFLMGSTEEEVEVLLEEAKLNNWGPSVIHRLPFESPRLLVRITRAFHMGAHEVTVGQFRTFVEDSNYRTDAEEDGEGGYGFNAATGKREQKPEYTWRNPGFAQTDNHPVVNVTWNDAVAFGEWLSSKERKAYRLPTEAEWEYACRAGTTTHFSFGDDASALDQYAWWMRNSSRSSHPVGRKRPNAWRLYDMHGNLWEWCADWYDEGYYADSPAEDPTGPASGARRVSRGGGFLDNPWDVRCANRFSFRPTSRTDVVGFRVARTYD